MTDITPDQQESLASAYEALSADPDRTVTIASLRSAAGVSQNVAAAWLRTKRAEEEAAERAAQRETTPDLPPKLRADHDAHLDALWVDAVTAARTEVVELHTAQLDDVERARQSAEQRADEATMRAETAEEKAAHLTNELTAVEAAVADLRAARDSWAQSAEAAQSEAKAATATLAETQSALVTAQGAQEATAAALTDLRAERSSWNQAAEVARAEARDATSALAEARGELTALRAVLAQQTEAS